MSTNQSPEPTLYAKDMLPKRIIQTGRTVPDTLRLQIMTSSVRSQNPDYEYLFFEDTAVEKFINQEFPQYRAIFDSFPYPIQRYDFFRYLAVYRFGGFYFDIDILLASPLDNLLQSKCIFPFEGLTPSKYLRTHHRMDWEVGNYAFGAIPNHPFLEAVIENCIRGQRDRKWVEPMLSGVPVLSRKASYVLCSTGPGLVSRTLAENPDLARQVRILMPDDVCNQDNWNCFGNFGIHLMDGSWRAKSGVFRRVLTRTLEQRKFRSIIRQSILLRQSN